MISIAEAISDLLFVRDTVVVPGLGAFVRKPCPAKLDSESNRLLMPTSQVGFNPDLREDNDVIIKYLVVEMGISEIEAKQMLSLFVSDSYKTMRSGQKIHLKNLGFLSLNPENELVFQQDSMTNFNPDAFGLSDISLHPLTPAVPKPESEERLEKPAEKQLQSDEKKLPFNDNDWPEMPAEPNKEEEEVHEIGKGVWAFMIGLVLIMSGILYFKVFYPRFDKNEALNSVEIEDTNANRQAAIESMVGEMVGQIMREEMANAPVGVYNNSNDTIRIIAGCYDREEPAQRMVNSLKNKGYVNAFMEKRGERWFVAYGRYHTEEQALEALREIREVYGGKGWILK